MIERVGRLIGLVAPPLVTLVIVVLVWDWLVTSRGVPAFYLPRPGRVLAALVEHRFELFQASLLTAAGAVAGFTSSLVVGTLIAFAFSISPIIQRSLYPYAILLQTVPIVAIAPLIILWFGRGFQGLVVVSAILSLFPIVTNVTTGLTRIDHNLLELFAVHRATWLETLFKLRLPNAVPYLVAGAKISCGLAVIGAIVGEMYAGHGTDWPGLGYLISVTSVRFKTDYAIAAVLCSTALGIGIFAIVSLIGNIVLGRWLGRGGPPRQSGAG